MTATVTPQTYSVNEAATVLGVSRSSIYGEFAAKRLTRVKIGRAVRIPRAEVDALAAGQQPPTPRTRRARA